MPTAISPTASPTLAPDHDEIAQAARECWVEAGQPEGRDDEFWLESEHRLLMARQETDMPDMSAVIFATLAQPVTRATITKDATPTRTRRRR